VGRASWRTIEHDTHVEYQSLITDLVLEIGISRLGPFAGNATAPAGSVDQTLDMGNALGNTRPENSRKRNGRVFR
jgi:hypothetical protein